MLYYTDTNRHWEQLWDTNVEVILSGSNRFKNVTYDFNVYLDTVQTVYLTFNANIKYVTTMLVLYNKELNN